MTCKHCGEECQYEGVGGMLEAMTEYMIPIVSGLPRTIYITVKDWRLHAVIKEDSAVIGEIYINDWMAPSHDYQIKNYYDEGEITAFDEAEYIKRFAKEFKHYYHSPEFQDENHPIIIKMKIQ